jgi:hypothetical protein
MHELKIVDPDGNKFTACIGTPTVHARFDQWAPGARQIVRRVAHRPAGKLKIR